MNRHFFVEKDPQGIAWLSFDKADSGTNVLTEEVLEAFDQTLVHIAQMHPRGLVIISAKESGFIAGAVLHQALGLCFFLAEELGGGEVDGLLAELVGYIVGGEVGLALEDEPKDQQQDGGGEASGAEQNVECAAFHDVSLFVNRMESSSVIDGSGSRVQSPAAGGRSAPRRRDLCGKLLAGLFASKRLVEVVGGIVHLEYSLGRTQLFTFGPNDPLARLELLHQQPVTVSHQGTGCQGDRHQSDHGRDHRGEDHVRSDNSEDRNTQRSQRNQNPDAVPPTLTIVVGLSAHDQILFAGQELGREGGLDIDRSGEGVVAHEVVLQRLPLI